MKKILLLSTALLLSACESSRDIAVRQSSGGYVTQPVQCVGIDRVGQMPGIQYKLSGQNTVLGIMFSEMIAPPVIVLLNETYCPVADTTQVR